MRWSDIVEFVPILLQGAGMTIFITVSCLILSTALGLVWGACQNFSVPRS